MPVRPSTPVPNAKSVKEALRFLTKVRQSPDQYRNLLDNVDGLDDLVALGEQAGFKFDGMALQTAYSHEFSLRMAIHQEMAGASGKHNR